MTTEERINAFVMLGEHLQNIKEKELEKLRIQARSGNSWFDATSVSNALKGIQLLLKAPALKQWIKDYDIQGHTKSVGVVLAGNIPAVGFHDVLCIIISGNVAVVKLSSKDTILMKYLIDQLVRLTPGISHYLRIVEQLKEIDAVIATGSDNTARYFEYYFSKYPNIIRKNRTSIGILNGREEKESLSRLGSDIFLYYGLGCRNVSKIYVPYGYKFDSLFEALQPFQEVLHHHKYHNNYDYNKAIYLVNKEPHFDNGFLLLKEDQQMVSPISVLFYETYQDENDLQSKLDQQQQKIQCIVSENAHWPQSYSFGNAQFPALNDYSDGIDTMDFLVSI